MKQTIIILGGGILQVSLIEEAHALNYHVICSDRDPNCACRDVCDTFWEIDTFDSAEHVKRAIKLVDEHSIQIIGCIAAGSDAIETAENVNGWVRTQTNNKHGFWAGFKATSICRNKISFRSHLLGENFNTPEFNIANNRLVNMKQFIIKAVDNSGGRGNQKFGDEPYEYKNLIKAVKYAQSQSKTKQAIVEELLIGKEYTVETIWEDGTMYPAFITDRYFRNDDKYAIEAGASHPSTLSTGTQGEIYSVMESLGNSLGMKYGPLKGDVMLVEKECPKCEGKSMKKRLINHKPKWLNCDSCTNGKIETIYILEATTRYSGGFDAQYLVPLATGKNILKAAIQCNVTGTFDKDLLVAKWDKYSMVGSPFPKEGKIVDVKVGTFHNWQKGDMFFINCKTHEYIKYRDSTNRPAFLIVSRETRVKAIQVMKEGLENIKIITE